MVTLKNEADVRQIMQWVYEYQSPERFAIQEDIDTVRAMRSDLRAQIGETVSLTLIMNIIEDFDVWDNKHDGWATFIGKLACQYGIAHSITRIAQ